jgi:hypothetical protein
MADINPPSPLEAITTEGKMIQRFRTWTQNVTRLINFLNMAEGTGTPEASLVATANKFYRDTAAGSLYWKSVDDVAGDTSLGWKLVV